MNDGELLDAFRNGDQAAFGLLFERHHSGALRLARRRTRDHHLAADAVHETFMQILAAIKAGSGPKDTFAPYLYVSVTREVHRLLKRQSSEVPVAEHHEAAAIQGDLSELFGDSDLQDAFRSLPYRWQLVLWRLEINGMPPREAAPLFEISPNAVVALNKRAKNGLRQAYAQRKSISQTLGGESSNLCPSAAS